MNRPDPIPPTLSRRLLEWSAERLGTPELADDAAELFVERVRSHGEKIARRWYRRQARASLGRLLLPGRRAARRAPGSGLLAGVSLDARLGVRMLARYPGLTLVGGLAMAFAIFVGATTFEFINQMLDPRLPLPGGERIVGLRYWDRAENEEALPLAYDLRLWREQLETVEDLGAFQTVERTLAGGGEAGEPVRVARMSPVGFRVARVPPLLGRSLVEGDEEPGASPVVVLGYRVWQTRFGGDPTVVGRTVRLGQDRATVVGVMPEKFAFPMDHSVWTPLQLDAHGGSEPGAPLRVFGRLAPGATLEEAQAEVGALAAHGLARRAAADAMERQGHLRAEVLPYARSLSNVRVGLLLRVMIYQLNVYAALFLILVSANVALLMFARAATREREIVVRSALGASRGRIVAQLFIEALVLGTFATVLGLAATEPALEWLHGILRDMGGELPFWAVARLSPATAVYAGLLTLVGAVVAGVVPALKATGRDVQARLQQAAPGAGGLRLGGVWAGVIVTQIAVTVVFTGAAYVIVRQAARSASVDAYFPAEQYLGARVEMDREGTLQEPDTSAEVLRRRYAAEVRELKQRIAEHAAVAGVTLTERLPVKSHASALVEVDDGGAAPLGPDRPGHTIFSGAVDLDFFQVLRTPVLAGRGFDSGDLGGGATTVVVNRSFVEEVLGGRSAVGRRIRYLDRARPGEPGAWHEIVGVVGDLVADRTTSLDLEDPPRGRVYHPLDPSRAGAHPLHIVAHVPSGPETLVSTLGRTAEAVSPALRLHEPVTLDRANSDLAALWRLWADLVVMVSAVALFLSLAGIYSVMSFTVARRRREIGVRVALGAGAPRVMTDIFRKPLTQVGVGVGVGCLLVGTLVWVFTNGRVAPTDAALLLVLGVGMLGICALACIGPTWRALRVEPTEALRADT